MLKYDYFADSMKKSPGTILVDKNTGSIKILVVAERDIDLGANYFGNKAVAELKQMHTSKNYQDEKILIWN